MRGGGMRVVVADDSMLVREGVVHLLAGAGFEVVGTAENAAELLRVVRSTTPDAVIVDIKMPPTHTDEGIVAAQQIRRDHPAIGVLVLSNYLESRYAMQLLAEVPEGVGYLLKERVSDVAVLTDALQRIVDGGCVVDPTIVARLMRRAGRTPIDELTDRERDVLQLMAEGRTNQAIGKALFLSAKTVEAHVRMVFQKLGLEPSAADHRRVLAVLALLRSNRGATSGEGLP
jgi:DNA-binding NarL/FixJ family response regulator